MRERHWEQLSEKLGFDVKPDASFTFAKCLELKLQDHMDLITKVGEIAGKEFGIETAMDKMESEWKPIDLEIMPYVTCLLGFSEVL
jgi:dynein heavy chain